VLKICGADWVRVEFDTTQIYDPRKPGCVVDHDFFCRSSRRKRQDNGSQPRWPLRGRALLVKRTLLGTVHETLQNNRTVPDSSEGSWRNREIVAHEIQFRDSCLR
jgi:hypothetical protein